ncbi:hypothetical protein AB0N17_46820, partial [Streptomyces sp. NPDC051133]|uniref:hypothetical protein n=1 Tax=Streptomyces sp. NPDC051133 TaxID=3155521 RepID=UPI003441EBC1
DSVNDELLVGRYGHAGSGWPPGSAAAGDSRFAYGPLPVLDGDLTGYGRGGQLVECPARTVAQLVEWTLG